MDAYKVAKAMTPFSVDNKTRAQQQKDLLAYVRELATRAPYLSCLRDFRQFDFDLTLLDFCEPTPKDGNSGTHAPTKAREDLAIILALTVKGNAAVIVQDAENASDGAAIFAKLIKAYGRSDGDGTEYLLELKEFSFIKAGDVNVFTSKFAAICNDYRNTTGAEIPTGIKRTSLLEALRTRDIIGAGGTTLAARAPDALTPLHQIFMSQKLDIDEMLHSLETTCENILATDPTALTQDTNSSALTLSATIGHEICTSCNGTGHAPKHAQQQRGERTTSARHTDRGPPPEVKWCDTHKWGLHSTEECNAAKRPGRGGNRDSRGGNRDQGGRGRGRGRQKERSGATVAAASADAPFNGESCMFAALADSPFPSDQPLADFPSESDTIEITDHFLQAPDGSRRGKTSCSPFSKCVATCPVLAIPVIATAAFVPSLDENGTIRGDGFCVVPTESVQGLINQMSDHTDASDHTDTQFGVACMFVSIGETEPPPSTNPWLFFGDPRTGEMRSVGRYGDIVATVAAALSEANGAPPLAKNAQRFLIDSGSQSTCANNIRSFGVAQLTPPTGEFGLPFALLDGGNGRHIVDHGGPLRAVTVEGGIAITFAKAVHAPTFAFDIISVGVMEESGVTTIFGPNARLEKGDITIPLGKHRALFFADIYTGTYPGGVEAAPRRGRDAITAPTHNAPMPELEPSTAPTHDAPTHGTPTLPIHDNTTTNSETYLRSTTLNNPDAEPWTPTVQYVEIYAGIGALSRAAEAHGGEVAMLIENEPVAQENLRHRFPDAEIYDDIDDPSWQQFARKPGAALGMFAGAPCQPFAPTGKQLMDDDPRARFLLEGVGKAVAKLRPETVDIETVCNVADAKDGAILRKLDDSIIQHGYSRIVPEGGASPEQVSTSHLGSAVDRKRIVLHFERNDMEGGPLPKLPTEPATGTKMETLAEHLAPNADDPADDAFKFVPGNFVRLDKPANLRPGDERSPLLVGHLIVGGALAALFVGAVVQIRKLSGLWRVLAVTALTVGMISTNRNAPTRHESKITDITAHYEQTLQVFSPGGTLVSPRTWGEPPVEANMLIERQGHPGRASCVLAAEAASAFGYPDLTAPTERDLQRLVGNTIEKTMADAIASRTHSRLVRFAIKNTAPATVAVLRSVPSAPPLLTQGGKPLTRPRLAPGLPLDTATLHATFGHASQDTLRATCAAYNMPTPKAATTCTTCATSNMHKARTYHSSRSPVRHTTGSSWSGDLIGPVHTQSRTGAVYGLHLTEHNTLYEYFAGLRSKSDALGEIETWHTTMTAAGARPRVLTTDLGGEFVGRAADDLTSRLRLAHRFRAPEAHVDNIESSHRRLYESVRPALREASAPSSLWEDACLWAVDTHNCRNVGGHVPHIALFGSFPDLTPLAPFYAHVAAYDGQGNHGRFASRSVHARYIGPARDCGIGAIRVIVNRHPRVVRTWRYIGAPDATVDTNTMRVDTPTHESPSTGETADPPSAGEPTPPTTLMPAAQREQVHYAADTYIGILEKEGRVLDEATASHLYSRPWTIPSDYRPTGYQWPTPPPHLADTTSSPPPPPGFTVRPTREKQPMVRFDPDVPASTWRTPTATVATTTTFSTPTSEFDTNKDGLHQENTPAVVADPGAMSLRTVLRRNDCDEWIKTISDERLDLPETFDDNLPAFIPTPRADVPADAQVFDSLITNVVRRNGKLKSRWVVDGSRRSNKGQTRDPSASSPTCLAMSVFLVLALAAQFGWTISQFDVVKAYMLATPLRTYFIRYPPGFAEFLRIKFGHAPFNPDHFLLRVAKNAYGAPDAGRVWYDTLSTFLLITLAFSVSPLDRCVFVLCEIIDGIRVICIILVYVDDLLVVGSTILKKHVIDKLKARFPLTEGGDDYLGLEIEASPGVIHVHQGTYVKKVVETNGYGDCKPACTPLTTDFTAADRDAPAGADAGAAARLDFRHANGQVGYVAGRTLPGLLFAFGVLSCVACPSAAIPDAPAPGHRAALGRVLRYMSGVIGFGLRFAHNATGFTLRLYVDASHGREAHHTAAGFCKSRSGGCIFGSGACIYAWSSIQQSTALSTFESELYALVLGTRYLLALRRITTFIIGATLPTSLVFCDNQSVIAQLLRRDLSSRSRHIRTNLGFLYEAIDNGDIHVEYIRSEANPANTHTAAENRNRFAQNTAVLSGRAELP